VASGSGSARTTVAVSERRSCSASLAGVGPPAAIGVTWAAVAMAVTPTRSRATAESEPGRCGGARRLLVSTSTVSPGSTATGVRGSTTTAPLTVHSPDCVASSCTSTTTVSSRPGTPASPTVPRSTMAPLPRWPLTLPGPVSTAAELTPRQVPSTHITIAAPEVTSRPLTKIVQISTQATAATIAASQTLCGESATQAAKAPTHSATRQGASTLTAGR
jgi:hypothetical protein